MIIQNSKELEILREGGKKLAAILLEVAHHAIPGVSARELDDLAEKLILKAGGKPSFKGYKIRGAPRLAGGQAMPYPGALCVSINDEIVHGLPTDKILRAGDVVGLDIGMRWEELFTDTALTILIAGERNLPTAQILQDRDMRVLAKSSAEATESARQLINATKKSLEIGIAQVRAGAHVGDIGYAIQKHLEGEGLGVVRELVGHGVGRAVHEEPEIPNWGHRGDGPELCEGQVIALEPMATENGPRAPKIKIAKDGWTWLTRDGSRSAHFEHTVVVTRTGAEILTRF